MSASWSAIDRLCALVAASAFVSLLVAPEAPALEIYWTDQGTGSIQRTIEGSGVVETVITGLVAPRDVSVDPTTGEVYFTEAGSAGDQIAKTDGQTRTDLYGSFGTTFIEGIDLDLSAGNLYVADHGGSAAGRLHVGSLQGSLIVEMPSVLPITDIGDPRGVFVDAVGGKVYWAEPTLQRLRRSNLDGSDPEVILSGLASPFGIAVDPIAGFIYWSDNVDNAIYRTLLSAPTLASPIVSGLNNPTHLAIAPSLGRIYWAEVFAGRVASASVDGSDVKDIVTGLSAPIGIAVVVPEPGTFVLIATGLVLFALNGRIRR